MTALHFLVSQAVAYTAVETGGGAGDENRGRGGRAAAEPAARLRVDASERGAPPSSGAAARDALGRRARVPRRLRRLGLRDRAGAGGDEHIADGVRFNSFCVGKRAVESWSGCRKRLAPQQEEAEPRIVQRAR